MDRRRKGRWVRREGDEEGRGGVGRRGEEGGGSRGGREELEWTDRQNLCLSVCTGKTMFRLTFDSC